MTDPVGLAIRTCFPFHFGTDEFIGLKAAAKMGSISFRPHRKFRIMWTAGDPVFIQRIVWIQISGSSAERNISTAELPWRAVWKDPEGTAGKKGLVVLDAVKGSIAQKSIRVYQRVLPEKVFQDWDQKSGIAD